MPSASELRFAIDPNLLNRFWSKVIVSDSDNCWTWTGAKNQYGYGIFSINDKLEKAHRVAYALANRGKISEGIHILHECDNPPCVNPSHLRPGSHEDNMRDKANRQRVRTGREKLTPEMVIKIRKDWDDGKYKSYQEVNLEYGITHSREIILRNKWKFI